MEDLYLNWIKEEKIDVVNVLLIEGISGLLFKFEKWLIENNYIVKMED